MRITPIVRITRIASCQNIFYEPLHQKDKKLISEI